MTKVFPKDLVAVCFLPFVSNLVRAGESFEDAPSMEGDVFGVLSAALRESDSLRSITRPVDEVGFKLFASALDKESC